jgi:hypothetical protein
MKGGPPCAAAGGENAAIIAIIVANKGKIAGRQLGTARRICFAQGLTIPIDWHGRAMNYFDVVAA